ncbi:actin nucleation-promoting factor WAS-like [Bacillus rossius redtenbacheri]|uniref:actin nucleation-promoting factor WAS-like n=1 Tax=Bacillus rossius redtenbacheri TaxID=93214 RepID=UPI002FDC9DEB
MAESGDKAPRVARGRGYASLTCAKTLAPAPDGARPGGIARGNGWGGGGGGDARWRRHAGAAPTSARGEASLFPLQSAAATPGVARWRVREGLSRRSVRARVIVSATPAGGDAPGPGRSPAPAAGPPGPPPPPDGRPPPRGGG